MFIPVFMQWRKLLKLPQSLVTRSVHVGTLDVRFCNFLPQASPIHGENSVIHTISNIELPLVYVYTTNLSIIFFLRNLISDTFFLYRKAPRQLSET